ncbi:hypothetical protein MUP32_06300, partial [Candidatus Microgenomates bacterium]|nr:hypothetical protein [Candidatus Microgenomates bacterium]
LQTKDQVFMGVITPFHPWLTYGHSAYTKACLAARMIESYYALYYPELVADLNWQNRLKEHFEARWSKKALADFGEIVGHNVEYTLFPWYYYTSFRNLGFRILNFDHQHLIDAAYTPVLAAYVQGSFERE